MHALLTCAACLMAAGAADMSPPAAHPNPIWARPWVSLDGAWRFSLDPDDAGLAESWHEDHAWPLAIDVPFPWQSELSGVDRTDYDGVAWYQRDVAIPAAWTGKRVFLVFGAVDWEATVWIDGRQAARRESGYTPFEIELTEYAEPGETVTLTVRTADHNDPRNPTGKQVNWYTHVGGIWQTVYLEARGQSYLESAVMTPDLEASSLRVRGQAVVAQPGQYEIVFTAREGGYASHAAETFSFEAGKQPFELKLSIPDVKRWSPESPTLYDAELELRRSGATVDAVATYFGMREVSRGTYQGSEKEHILLNGEPVYIRGALHQSYNPGGLYTHPDDAYIRRDYELAKAAGFNCLRIHIKSEEPRALYWADKLGVLLMCDMPNYWEKGPAARADWERVMRETVTRDINHPSIFSWVNFNETWGIGDGGYGPETQRWALEMFELTKSLDPTRLVEDNSPCRYDHVKTDINSWHFYSDNYDYVRGHIAEVVAKTYPGSAFNYVEGCRQRTAPLMNSEYGGVGAGSGDRDVGWVFLWITNLLRKHDAIRGYIYTELTDIEWEHNGIYNYDRRPKAFPYPEGVTLAGLQDPTFPVLDRPPYARVAPGEALDVPVLVSHWREAGPVRLELTFAGKAVDGQPWSEILPGQTLSVDAAAYAVTPGGTFRFDAPARNGLLSAVVTARQNGEALGANYCVFDIRGGESWADEAVWTGTFEPGDYAEFTFGDVDEPVEGKVSGLGAGDVAYRLAVPAEVAENIAAAALHVELAAKADEQRLDWPARGTPQDYPQTDEPAWPTEVVLALDGEVFHRRLIANDFADVQGVLSHVAGVDHGSRGEVVRASIQGGALDKLRAAAAAERPVTLTFRVPASSPHAGGLTIFGEHLGAWPAHPTLALRLDGESQTTAGRSEAPLTVLDAERRHRLILVATAPNGGVWRYTEEPPDSDAWTAPWYDDRDWRSGKGGFGAPGTPGARIGTEWRSGAIWLRREFDVPADFALDRAWLEMHHDEAIAVYVNGAEVLRESGYLTRYVTRPVDLAGLLRPGETNTLAVHCRQSEGGQYVDAGLLALEARGPEGKSP